MLTGCSTPFRYNFPSDISALCYGCRNDAKAKIQATGTPLSEKVGVQVIKHPGAKNISGIWAWYYQPLNVWVYGMCNGTTIDVSCNPVTGLDVSPAVLTHEMAHYWLMSNYNDRTHGTKYDALFINWRMSREAIGFSVEGVYINYNNLKQGQTMAIDVFADGKYITLDCVKP